MSYRMDQVNSVIKKQLSEIIIKDEDRYLSLVTITDCKTAPDLSQVKIWVSFLGDNSQKALNILQQRAFFYQQQLNNRVHLKKCPKIFFKLDESADGIDRINKILGHD